MEKMEHEAGRSSSPSRSHANIMVRLVNVKPLPGYRLHLAYNDGTTGEVELVDMLSKGIFNALLDQVVFATATLGEHGEVRWNDELELCGDALYLQLTGKSVDQLFPKG